MLFRVIIIASLYRFFRNLLCILSMGHTNPLYGQISRQLIFDISRPVACHELHTKLRVGIHQNCLTLKRGNCLTSWAAKSCTDFLLCWVDARQDLTAPIFGIYQALRGNCQKVFWQKIYFMREVFTQAS
jgi:hypothetical protein